MEDREWRTIKTFFKHTRKLIGLVGRIDEMIQRREIEAEYFERALSIYESVLVSEANEMVR